jgi:hypothetical protein
MANSNGWGDGAGNNAIGWGQGANNSIGWGDSHAKSWAGLTDIVGITTDPDAQAFITAAAITDATQQDAIDALVVGLKTDGIWTKMKAIYPFVGGTASTHKYNLKDPRDLDAAFRLVFNGGWTHSVNGATPNGTNGYADTKLQMQQLSNASNNISLYMRTSNTGVKAYAGVYDLVRYTILGSSVGNYYNSYNAAFGTASGFTNSGLLSGNYLSGVEKIQKNGVTQASVTIANTASTSTQSYYLSAFNLNGTPSQYASTQLAYASLSDGLTDTEAANLYTRVQAFQTALSRQV